MASRPRGSWNRALGWALLVAGFAGAVVLDPWSLGERDPAAVVGSPRMAARHAQAVVVGMAFLQFVVADLLAAGGGPAAAGLTAIGSLLYCAGYLVLGHWPPGVWLAPLGAALNLAGLALVAAAGDFEGRRVHQAFLGVLCLGMLLDVVMGLAAAGPDGSWVAWLGPEDGLRLRLLRLARAAVIALSVLALLYRGLRDRVPEGETRLVRWGGHAMLFGAVAMPVTLVLAAFASFRLKYLLPVPAQAVFLATLLGAGLAWRHRPWLERWGWLLVVAGIGTGLLMGLYAFQGPLPDPAYVGAYNDFPRRLLRLGHAYAIVLGLAGILLARVDDRPVPGAAPFGAASLTTLAGLTLVATLDLPVGVLTVGPALVVAALLPARRWNRP